MQGHLHSLICCFTGLQSYAAELLGWAHFTVLCMHTLWYTVHHVHPQKHTKMESSSNANLIRFEPEVRKHLLRARFASTAQAHIAAVHTEQDSDRSYNVTTGLTGTQQLTTVGRKTFTQSTPHQPADLLKSGVSSFFT